MRAVVVAAAVEEVDVVFGLVAEKSDAPARETGASVGESWHPTAP